MLAAMDTREADRLRLSAELISRLRDALDGPLAPAARRRANQLLRKAEAQNYRPRTLDRRYWLEGQIKQFLGIE